MSTISFLNQPLSTSIVNNTTSGVTDLFFVIWKLTRAMKKAGWTYKSSGDGTTLGKDTTGVAANDKWGGNADPAADTYPNFNSASAWWNAQGPSTLKIPISTASTGTFIRGEDISQATTGAHGELLGYLWDIPTSQGYLVVAPRVNGSGGDPHGWDHTHVITGAISGATITPSATIIEFVREVVFWKSNVAGASGGQGFGNIYYQCVDQASESAFRFSSLAVSASACTGNIAPGGGNTTTGTGNTFPTVGSFVVIGCAGNTTSVGTQSLPASGNVFGVTSTVGFPATGSLIIGGNTVNYTNISGNTFTGCSGGSGTITAGTIVSVNAWPSRWTNHTSSGGQNQCHVVALNNTPASNISADGSFWIAVGAPASTNPWTTDNGVYDGWMFSIVDNAEPGDVDPYAWYVPSVDSFTSNPLAIPGAATAPSTPWSISTQNSGAQFRILRRRGMPSGDGFTNACHGVLTFGTIAGPQLVLSQNTADRETLACTFNTTYLTEDVWILSNQAYSRLRKGVMRWMKAVATGGNASGTDTFGGRSWVQLSTTAPPYIAGPWDGATTPVNGHV